MIVKIETEDGIVTKSYHIDTDSMTDDEATEVLIGDIEPVIRENWQLVNQDRQSELDLVDDIFASLTGG